jgi:hypothetical protein
LEEMKENARKKEVVLFRKIKEAQVRKARPYRDEREKNRPL